MHSMTGFGRAEGAVGPSRVSIEIKSVNHRYLDVRFRLPYFLMAFETELAEVLRGHFERGSFEVQVRHKQNTTGSAGLVGTRFVVDGQAAQSLMECYEWLHKHYKTEKIPPAEVFSLANRVIVPVEEAADLEKLSEPLTKVFVEALEELKVMRAKEGNKLRDILAKEIDELASLARELEKVAPLQPSQIAEKLRKRLEAWNLNPPIEAARLEQEIAMYAEKSDFTEELDRLRTHEKAFRQLLGEGGSLGRKLDFLTQELHREFNTLGSKASLIEITRLVLAGKASIEKLRQQVQNVE